MCADNALIQYYVVNTTVRARSINYNTFRPATNFYYLYAARLCFGYFTLTYDIMRHNSSFILHKRTKICFLLKNFKFKNNSIVEHEIC